MQAVTCGIPPNQINAWSNDARAGRDSSLHRNDCVSTKKSRNICITLTQSDGNFIEDSTSSNKEASSRETFRLASYNMCQVAASPYLLAMAGFYNIGPGDRSRCFSCGNCVESWQVADDVSSPSWHKPDCKHTFQEDSGNIKLTEPSKSGSHVTSGSKKRSKILNQPSVSKLPTSPSSPIPSYPHEPLPPPARPTPNTSHSSHTPILLSTVYYREHQMLLESLSLEKEADRRKSFSVNWPIHLASLVNDLSHSGFFFLGNHDRTQCFSCGAVLKSWLPSDNIAAVHAQRFPECRMVLHVEPRNIPLPRVQGYYFDPENVHHWDVPAGLNENPLHPPVASSLHSLSPSTSTMRSLPRSGPYHVPSAHMEEAIDRSAVRYPPVSYSNPSSEVAHSSTSSQAALYRHPDGNLEVSRSYGSPSHVLPRSLPSSNARPLQPNLPSARFPPASYGNSSIAQPSETVVMQPVQSQFEVVQTGPSGSELVASYPPAETSHPAIPSTSSNLLDELDPYSASRRPPIRLPQSELDVGEYLEDDVKNILQYTYPCEQPKNPSMVYFGQRLSSFRAPWPENDSLSTVTQTAEAGFYYLGLLDHVCCWYCGTKAENWAHKTTAWEIHARLFPTCQYLLRNRGPDFVEAVLSQVTGESRSANETISSHVAGQEPSSGAVVSFPGGREEASFRMVESGPDRLPTPPLPLSAEEEAEERKQEFRTSMTSHVVRDALAMGFSRQHIRKVVKKQIERWSCNFQTTEALIDALEDFPPDLIDLDSSDEEEETPPPPRRSNQGLSFRDLDETAELYRGSESNISNPTEDIEGEINPSIPEESPRRSQGQSMRRQPIQSQAPSHSRMGDVHEIRSKLLELRNEKRCKVCLDREGCMLFTPCGHICACEECTRSLRHCPICRTQIRQAIRTYTP